MTKKKLYVYHKPNTMLGHNYSDDVVITYATTKEEAMEKFKEFDWRKYESSIGSRC